MPRITIHNIEVPSRSDRAFWLLEELGATYDVITYLREPTLMRAAPRSLFEHSLFGKGPALSIDGESFGESGYVIYRILGDSAIIAGAPGHMETTHSNWSVHWAHAAEAAGMTRLQGEAMVRVGAEAWIDGRVGGGASEGERRGMTRFLDWYTGQIDRPQSQNFIDKGTVIIMAYLEVEQWLSDHEGRNFTGTEQFGAGDFMMLAGIRSLCEGSRKDCGYVIGPYIKAWWDRVSSRPQYQRAMARIEQEESEERIRQGRQ